MSAQTEMGHRLRRVLKAWYADATSETPTDIVKTSGLCHYTYELDEDVLDELRYWLRKDCGDSLIPFTPGDSYYQEQVRRKAHENPRRLAWVREKLGIKEAYDGD